MTTPSSASLSSRTSAQSNARSERLFVVAWLAASAILPPVFWEAFPFTACPMFAMPHDQSREYTLFDADGKRLNSEQYGIWTNFNWYIEGWYPVKYRENLVNPSYRRPDMNSVVNDIRREAHRLDARFPLKLQCVTTAAVSDNTVGVISDEEWTIQESHDQ